MRRNKYIAPVIITVLLAAYYIGIAALFAKIPDIPLLIRVLAVMIPLLLCGVLVYVLLQRIREIKSGEEDDLDKF